LIKQIEKYYLAKEKFSKSVVLIKCGIFYEIYNEDAYIISYIFDYKIKEFSSHVMAGFPEKVIEKVKGKLTKEGISYVILDNDKKFISIKKHVNYTNYEVLLDISCKSYKIEMEIAKIKQALDILKRTKSINKIIRQIKEIL
jgi:DNA mismatch repair ATPase MutS